MEIVSGANNWKLVIRREETGITILRAVTCDEAAALPEELFGLPVTVLGDHALAPGAKEVSGEAVRITCGPGAGEDDWDNRRLRRLTLPAKLRRVEDYALMNCRGLRELRLYDDVRYWGGSTLMNCRGLDTIHLTRTGAEQGESLHFFASELSWELDVTIVGSDGRTARLLFPEYVEIYEENCPAHHFDYFISGAGYPYHHCFRQKKLQLRDYDDLWKGYLGTEHEEDSALRLAWWRLRYPLELGDKAEAAYLSYLRAHTAQAVDWLLSQRDMAGLAFLLERTEPSRETLTAACGQARRMDAPEAVALLLEEQHRRFPTGMEKCFDL